MANNLTYSTELMQNFLQAEIVSPQKKFEALQTNDGYSLLFSISTDHVFYLTEQQPEHSSGWEQIDLSSQLSDAHQQKRVIAKDFAVTQNISTGKINLVLAVTVDDHDYLYLSLNNENTQGAITSKSIQWTIMPYDDPQHKGITLNIKNLYIAEASNKEYIVVDISKSTFSKPTQFIQRYYINSANLANPLGQVWNTMVVGGDLNPGVHTSLGRPFGERVDGTYTLGAINGKTELLYAPLYNVWNPKAPPTISRLQVPKGATALDTTLVDGNETDLFVAADQALYYFAANNQNDGATAVKVLSNELFEGVNKLFAYATDKEYIVWGLNRADQVFYTKCNKALVTNSSAWSYPLPILDGVNKISPYINKVDDGNLFFAVAGDELIQVVQSPKTTLWDTQRVTLKAPIDAKAKSFTSYTTRIQLQDEEDQPMAHCTLNISTSTRVPVYINHLYYVLDTTPIPIKTDALGSITVVELANELVGTTITVEALGKGSITINPMDKAFGKIASLDTADKLKAAVITHPDGSTTPLVDQSISKSDLQVVASYNTQLKKAYAKVSKATPQFSSVAAVDLANVSTLTGFGQAIVSSAGDLFSWLESGIESVIHLVEDTASGFWNFVVQIGGKIYQAVLDTIEAVVGAVKWIYKVIKTTLTDLIRFLEFLFEWKDITRTKKVIKNLTKVFLQHEVDQIEIVKNQFNYQMQKFVKDINDWAGIDSWSGLGKAATSKVNSSSTPSDNLSASNTLLSHHFQNNAGNITLKSSSSMPVPPQSPINTLFQTLKNEGKVLDAVLVQFKQLANDYSDMNLEDILKRVIGILTDGALESAQNVVDALFDILYQVLNNILEVLDTPIHIPVVSDILESFGVSSISLLDLFCWIAAVPVTLTYKTTSGHTPFKDNAYTQFLTHTNDYNQLVAAFSGSNDTLRMLAALGNDKATTMQTTLISIPDNVANAVFVTGHTASGFFTLMSCFISSAEAAAVTGDNPFAIPSAVLGIMSAITLGTANVLVPKDPVKNKLVGSISKATTTSVVLAKLIFSGPAQKKLGASAGIMHSLKANDGRATAAIVNNILIIPALACSCWHFYELAQTSSGGTRSAAIIEETANLTSYISRIGYAVAVNSKNPKVKAVSIGAMVVANVVTAGLQTAEAMVGS